MDKKTVNSLETPLFISKICSPFPVLPLFSDSHTLRMDFNGLVNHFACHYVLRF